MLQAAVLKGLPASGFAILRPAGNIEYQEPGFFRVWAAEIRTVSTVTAGLAIETLRISATVGPKSGRSYQSPR